MKKKVEEGHWQFSFRLVKILKTKVNQSSIVKYLSLGIKWKLLAFLSGVFISRFFKSS